MRRRLGWRFEGERRDIVRRDKGIKTRANLHDELTTSYMNEGIRIPKEQARELAEDFLREHHD